MIHVLPIEVANRIAAGEVVERPASVIRELLDNSIDAGATRIDVEVENGGIKLIQITDNGHGMSREDAAVCVQRHATSKIHNFDDLLNLKTKGFRGEALAAISSIARFELKTRRKEDEFATWVRMEDGRQLEPQNTGAPFGTTITIRDLFYNTPARLKFLKKPSTEQGHIMSAVTALALAHERIHFTVTHNGKRTLDCPSVMNRPERIKQLFGRDVLEAMIPVNLETSAVTLSGMISRPTLTRNGAQHIFFFVNGRLIKDRLLHRALMNGYSNLIPSGRYPVVFLYYDIVPSEIDINVHPTKQEIKFSNESAVFTATYSTVRQAWDKKEDTVEAPPEKRHPVEYPGSHQTPKPPQPQKQEKPEIPKAPSVETDPLSSPTVDSRHSSTPEKAPEPARQNPDQTINKIKQEEPVRPSVEQLNRKVLQKTTVNPTDPTNQPGQNQNGFQELRNNVKQPDQLFAPRALENTGRLKVIGQMLESYILAEGDGGLFIIDQHAAHERVMFERFLTQAENAPLESQPLLFPITVDVAPDDAVMINDNLHLFNQLGMEIESFGPKTFVIRSIPTGIKLDDAEPLIHDLLGELQREGNAKEKRDRALHTMACRAAVKFGDPLTHEDMKTLITTLESIPRRNVCPHGRPSILYVSDDGLRKAFKRTGF